MTETIAIQIISAEEELYNGEAEMVVAPAALGEVGIMPQHAPMLTILQPGPVYLHGKDVDEEVFYVAGGIMEVLPSKVMILADVASRAGDLDASEAELAKQEAEKQLSERSADFDHARVAADLARAVAQLRTIKQLRKKKK